MPIAVEVAKEIDALTHEFCVANAAKELLAHEDNTHGPYVAMIGTIAAREGLAIPRVWVGVYDTEDSNMRIAVRADGKDGPFWAAVDRELFRLANPA